MISIEVRNKWGKIKADFQFVTVLPNFILDLFNGHRFFARIMNAVVLKCQAVKPHKKLR